MIPKENQGDIGIRVPPNSVIAHRMHTDQGHDQSPPVPLANKAITSIAVIDKQGFTRQCITKCLQLLEHPYEVASFPTCEECLQSMESIDLVIYYAHHTMEHWSHNNQENTSLIRLLRTTPVLILSDINCPDCIIDLFEIGARGFVPTADTTIQQINEIIGFISVGGIFVPSSSLFARNAKGRHVTGKPARCDQFTCTENAILDRLKLGKPNKIIAYELQMSESTVKAHIGRIMKKLKATNRTQIVCRAYALAEPGMST
jgi:DNA-binding NarL/FixJ family response regulator